MRTATNGRARTADPITRLRGDVAAIRQDLAALAGGGLGTVTDAAKGALNKAGDTARHMAERAADIAEDTHQRLSDAAAERPVTTILISAAAGAALVTVLGWLWRR